MVIRNRVVHFSPPKYLLVQNLGDISLDLLKGTGYKRHKRPRNMIPALVSRRQPRRVTMELWICARLYVVQLAAPSTESHRLMLGLHQHQHQH